MSKVESSPVRGRYVLVSIGVLMVAVAVVALALIWPRPNAETLSRQAREAFMARKFDKADAYLAQVLRMREPTTDDSMLQAGLFMLKGQDDQALVALRRASDDPRWASTARLQAGQVELRRNRFGPAETWLLEALKIDPKLEKARRELIYIYGMQLRRPELNASFRALSEIAPLTYSEVFLWCLSRGVSWEAAEIVKTLDNCIKADPNDRWARLGKAEGLRELARFDEAEAALAPLPGSDPAATAARVRIALDRGDTEGVSRLLENGSSEDVDLALLRGRFSLARGDGAEAVKQFRIAYKLAPNLREAVLGLSQAYKNNRDLKAAAPLAEEARKHERLGTLIQKASVEKNRDDPVLMKELGAACLDLGRLHEARAWYNLAVSRDPLDTQAQEGLARVKERIEKP